VAVKTALVAKDINIDQPLTWSSAARLTLDAQQSVVVKRAVSVTGGGSLTIATNDGGADGEFYVQSKAGVQFGNLHSSLIISGESYTLVGDVKSLASAIHRNSLGNYALANPYDASQDGRYKHSPVSTAFNGKFEGLGNPISHLTIRDRSDNGEAGLFSKTGGNLNDVIVPDAFVSAVGSLGAAGVLAAVGNGRISHCFTSGKVFATRNAGGLVAESGNVSSSGSTANVEITSGEAGGLVAEALSIFESYATGNVLAGDNSTAGGVVAVGNGFIATSYGRGTVTAGTNSYVGGLVGLKLQAISESYSTGSVAGGAGSLVGGFVGSDSYSCCNSSDYWDVEASGTDRGTGSGNEANVIGLTTVQLISGLPQGFTGNVWAEKSHINEGYPYLLANPPK
jgi:hypothetical protein